MLQQPVSPSLPAPDAPAVAVKRVCVLGLGYVGLPTALLFARKGFSVQGVDISPAVLDNIAHDRIEDIYPELAGWWREALTRPDVDGLPAFRASAVPEPADVFIITVPTPVHPETRHCDLSAVQAAAQAIVPVLAPGNVVILESTVPPGTTRHKVRPILEAGGLRVQTADTPGDIHLCFCPERILPGNTVHELVHNHRVLGGLAPASATLARDLFARVIEGEIYLTDDMSAEFCKLAENTYRDVNIALANELSLIADELGLDLRNIRPLVNQHPRVNLLQPGIGVGGHCIAVDPWFFVEASPWRTELIATSRRVNDRMPAYCVQKILADIADIPQARICAVGLTYKPDVADTRESPAIRIVQLLREKGLSVTTYDPLLPEDQGKSLEAAAAGCDLLVFLVGHTPVMAEWTARRDTILQAMRTPRCRQF